jgi:hypothetical protein
LSGWGPSLVIGYHGGERDECVAAVNDRKPLSRSDQKHDWLGAGTYFWDSDPKRALEWAEEKKKANRCKDPYVVGAIIDLGKCLDLTQRANLDLLERAHQGFEAAQKMAGLPMPQNRDSQNVSSKNKVIRTLDCAVLNYFHTLNKQAGLPPYDTVRGVFVEGDAAYTGSEIFRKTHIQIAVCNDACIKAVFHPR